MTFSPMAMTDGGGVSQTSETSVRQAWILNGDNGRERTANDVTEGVNDNTRMQWRRQALKGDDVQLTSD